MTRAAAMAVAAVLVAAGANLLASGCGRSPEAPVLSGDTTGNPAEGGAAAPEAKQAPVTVENEGAVALRKVVEAERSLVYTGTKVSSHGEGGRATRMKVSRFSSGQTLLEWDAGSGQTKRWTYRRHYDWRENPDLLLRNYTVAVDPAEGPTIANRKTWRLSIRGVRPQRPTRELFVDQETWLVLREEFRHFDGKLWLTITFESLEYREPDDPGAEVAAQALSDPRPGAELDEPLPLAVTTAPDGFRRMGGLRGFTGRKREWTKREDWSDGLAAFSVKEFPATAEGDETKERCTPKEGEVQRRTRRGFSSVCGTFRGITVVVMGNLPVEELESVVRGLVSTPPTR